MISLFDLLKTLQANVNPHQAGHIRPQQNFERWCNEINQELFEELARQWEKNNVISDKLSPFLRSVNVTLVPQPGKSYDIFLLPVDYRYFSSARILLTSSAGEGTETGGKCCGCSTVDGATGSYIDEDEVAMQKLDAGSTDLEAPARKVDNMRWGAALQHRMKKPTPQRPLITAFDGGFKVAPRGLGILVLDFLRPPVDAKFAYTLGPDDQIIYDVANSIPLEWNGNAIPDFISRLEAKYGMYVRDEFSYQGGQLHRAQVKS